MNGTTVSVTARGHHTIGSPLYYRVHRYAVEAACLALGLVLVIWSITPIYNMLMIALDSHDDVFS